MTAVGARHQHRGAAPAGVGVGDVAAAVVAVVCAAAVVFVPDGAGRAAAAFVTVVFLAVGAVGCDALLSGWRHAARRGRDRDDDVLRRVVAAAGRPGRAPMIWSGDAAVGGDVATGRPWPLAVPLLSGVLAPGAVLTGAVVALSIGWRIESIGAVFSPATSQGPAPALPALGTWLVTLVVAAAVAVLAAWAAPVPQRWTRRRRRVLGVPVRGGDAGFVAVAGDEFTVGLRALVVGAAVVALVVGAAPDGVVDFLARQPVAAAVLAVLVAFVAAPGVEAAAPGGLVLAPFGPAAVVGFVIVCLVLDRRGAAAVADAAGRTYACWCCAVVGVPAVAVASLVGAVVS